jgi:general secretion pathway protein A
VLSRLNDKTKAAFIFYTGLSFDELLSMVLIELGLVELQEGLQRWDAVRRLHKFAIEQFVNGNNVVLLIDEAQNLDHNSLENLRLLSNLETYKRKLIQIILSGQPELDNKLSQPELRQLTQRINLKRKVLPLNKTETHDYIEHRLSIAKYSDLVLFSSRALQLIWEYSEGIPLSLSRWDI